MRAEILQELFKEIEKLSVTQWAERYRTLPKKTSNFDGPMSYDLTPYLRKIANSIMQLNPAQIIAIMKGSQLGFSIGGIFSMLGWIISQDQANTLFITETDKKVKQQMNGPINEMINHSDCKDLVGNSNIRDFRDTRGKRNISTGDTSDGIEFGDGTLYTWSGQQIGKLSSWSVQYGLYDEVDRWKGNYANAGNFMKLVEPRHKSFKNEMKMIFGSTPEIDELSNIKPLYLNGNQEKYHIPCKHCGEEIHLIWYDNINGEKAGVVFDRDKNGKFIENSARYVCQSCGGTFKQKHVFHMYDEENIAFRAMERGQKASHVCDWKPTAEPLDWRWQSFHLSSLYSPEGFFDWNHYAREWADIHPVNAPVKKGALQAFMNQVLGETYKKGTKNVKANQLQSNCRNYAIGTVPNKMSVDDGNGEIIMLTMAMDMNGTMGDAVEDDDVRLDWEIRAWCVRGDELFVNSYSIDHGSIGTFVRADERHRQERQGTIDEDRKKYTYRFGFPNSVWNEASDILNATYKSDDGRTMKIGYAGLDTGNFTKYANEFVRKHDRCIGLKGADEDNYTSFKNNKDFFAKIKDGVGYLVEGNRVKDLIADKIEESWDIMKDPTQPLGFINFATPSETKYTYDKYFKEFEGEHRILKYDASNNPVGMKWEKKHTYAANHYWDCAVYNEVLPKIACYLVCREKNVEVSWKNFCAILGFK